MFSGIKVLYLHFNKFVCTFDDNNNNNNNNNNNKLLIRIIINCVMQISFEIQSVQ